MTLKDIVLALLVVLIWGANFTVIKIGLLDLPPLLFSALRFSIVALPAVFFIPFPKTSIWNVIAVGVFLGVIKFSLLFIGMDVGVSAGLASLLLQAQVLFTILLSMFWFKETISSSQMLGIAIAALGFMMFSVNTGVSVSMLGLLLMLLAALSWAVSNIIMKNTGAMNLLHFMVWVSLVPPLPLFVLSYIFESDQPLRLLAGVGVDAWLAVAYVGLVSTLLAFALWGHLLKQYAAAVITPFALLIPVVGMTTSAAILDEQLSWFEFMAAGLVLLGLLTCVFGGAVTRHLAGGENFAKGAD